MRRREFIGVLGGAAAWPVVVRAQQPERMRRIGVLVLGSPPPGAFLKGLRDELRDAGYTEARNIQLEIRSAEGKADFLPEMAAELVRLKVDIIVAFQTPAATAAKQATGETPIVMIGVGDPIGTGLIASFARPGGNVTGTTVGTTETAGKTVELIREVIPSARRFAVLANEIDPFAKPFLAAMSLAARSAGMEMETVLSRPTAPLEAVFATATGKRVDAVIVQGSLQRKELFDLAIKHRLPVFTGTRLAAELGALMAYTPNFSDLYRETAAYIDKIFKGAKPADLPVAFPTKFELVINIKTAKAIGLEIPSRLLFTANEVIE